MAPVEPGRIAGHTFGGSTSPAPATGVPLKRAVRGGLVSKAGWGRVPGRFRIGIWVN